MEMYQIKKPGQPYEVRLQSILKREQEKPKEEEIPIRDKPTAIVGAYQMHQLMYLVIYENNTQDMVSAAECLNLWPDLVATFKRL